MDKNNCLHKWHLYGVKDRKTKLYTCHKCNSDRFITDKEDEGGYYCDQCKAITIGFCLCREEE